MAAYIPIETALGAALTVNASITLLKNNAHMEMNVKAIKVKNNVYLPPLVHWTPT